MEAATAGHTKLDEAMRAWFRSEHSIKPKDRDHRHFANVADVPFEKLAELGKGGSGYVDKVRSTVTYKEYARKLLPRGRTFRKDQAVLRDFERELGNLKKLSHQHIVELIGSYTDPR